MNQEAKQRQVEAGGDKVSEEARAVVAKRRKAVKVAKKRALRTRDKVGEARGFPAPEVGKKGSKSIRYAPSFRTDHLTREAGKMPYQSGSVSIFEGGY